MTKHYWEMAGSIANASRGNLQASIDLTKPGEGLHVQDGQTSPVSLRILGVEHSEHRKLDHARGEFYARGSDVVATNGQDVTLFGGAGADGALVVCGVEEVHAS